MTIKLESKINFKEGDLVRYNPYNHLFRNVAVFIKNANRWGTVYFADSPTKCISVCWDDTQSIQRINYQRLLITNKQEVYHLNQT